ncbi:hypothetical protein Tco_0816226 [Tanacetum coccineum]
MKEGYVKSDRTKHIPPRFFLYTQDLIKDNQVEMRYVQSSKNSANLFTKALPTAIFRKDIHNIGMRHVRRMFLTRQYSKVELQFEKLSSKGECYENMENINVPRCASALMEIVFQLLAVPVVNALKEKFVSLCHVEKFVYLTFGVLLEDDNSEVDDQASLAVSSKLRNKDDKDIKKYVVPTGRVVVPAGRYIVPAGKVILIVSTGRLSLVPTGRVLSPGRVK